MFAFHVFYGLAQADHIISGSDRFNYCVFYG